MSANSSHDFNRDDGGGLIPVHFVCQGCAQPLRIGKSLCRLGEPTIAELSGFPIFPHSSNDRTLNLAPTSSRTSIGSSSEVLSTENGNNGFMMIGRTPDRDLENLSYTFKVMNNRFDILSDQSDVDHPLCDECTDNLLDQMDEQISITEEECKHYNELLKVLLESESTDNLDELEQDLKILKLEEADLENQLKEIEEQKTIALRELEEQVKEEELLVSEEKHYSKEYCNLQRQTMLFKDEQRSVDNQLQYAEAQLNKFKNTNVFNVTFHIWYCKEFGSINNFRLGRLPHLTVEWHEINAAWGQTVLLLHSLAKKINLTFQRYRLVPYGNHSYLECLADNKKELPLYGSDGTRYFWNTKFDQAMVGYLDCLQQFKEEVERRDTGCILPYKMDKGRIEDNDTVSYSIRIQFNSEEQWTKALKLMLTNLKYGLAWVTSQYANKCL